MSKSTTGCKKTIKVAVTNGKLQGVAFDNKLFVITAHGNTSTNDKLQVGDKVTKLNGIRLEDTKHFISLLRTSGSTAQLMIVRDEKKFSDLESQFPIPAERERFFQRRKGYSYHFVTLEWNNVKLKLGLGIKHYYNRILVSRILPNSLADLNFSIGDRIVEIDGELVGHKRVASYLIKEALKLRRYVTCVVERPQSCRARCRTMQAVASCPTKSHSKTHSHQ